jgi:hypothetical protein
MGNQNSVQRRETREARRNTRKWQEFADNHDESGRGAAVIEQHRRLSPVAKMKNYKVSTFDVAAGENGLSRGFKIQEDSLMIIDITNPMLQGQMLPEGSIIRGIHDRPVYDYDQFCLYTENKSHYTMTVLTPKITGVWKVSPSKNHRQIFLHKETLTVLSTSIRGFPRDPQIIKSVNGCPVLSYTEYLNLVGEKTKFFITVVPAKRDDVSATSIDVFLKTVNLNPNSIPGHDLELIRRTLEESISEVNSELNMRMQTQRPEMYNYDDAKYLEPVLDHPPAGLSQIADYQENRESQQVKMKRSGKKIRGKRW